MAKAQAPMTPVVFATGLAEHLSHVRVTQKAITEAKNFLTGRRALRKKRPKKERGYEYVVELVFRPTITEHAKNTLGITSDSSRHIYSSHFHTTSDP